MRRRAPCVALARVRVGIKVRVGLGRRPLLICEIERSKNTKQNSQKLVYNIPGTIFGTCIWYVLCAAIGLHYNHQPASSAIAASSATAAATALDNAYCPRGFSSTSLLGPSLPCSTARRPRYLSTINPLGTSEGNKNVHNKPQLQHQLHQAQPRLLLGEGGCPKYPVKAYTGMDHTRVER